MQNYIKTILSAFKTWTQKKIKESTADWNENDSSKSNYIKNRTHWEEQDGTIHKLDKKYLDLPTNLATTDDVQEAVDLANEAQNTANTAVTNAATAQSTADTKMDKSDPAGKGSFSMNRKANTTIGPYSHAEGYNNTASGWNSHAEGEYNVASESDAHAEGLQTTASGMASHAEGSGTTASGAYSHAEGEGTVAGGKGSHAGGMYNISDTSTIDRKTGRRKYTHIIGNGTSDTARSNAHTLDWEGNAWYSGDVYVGSTSGTNRDKGSKKLATVEEVQELAVEKAAEAARIMKDDILNGAGAAYDTLKEVGVLIEENKEAIEALEIIAGVQADWNQSDENAKDYIKNKPSLDKYATTSQLSSLQTQVSGKMQQNNPWGSGSFSLNGSNSTGERAVEVNNHNTASGADSFAQGSSTTAWGVASHSEGSATIARGAGSHAEGYFSKTKADAKGAHAEGGYATASTPFQHAEGRANVEDDDGVYAHIVGNGTDDENRSNAYALDWQGNGWFAGDVYVGSTSGIDKDEGSKKLATEDLVAQKTQVQIITWGADD